MFQDKIDDKIDNVYEILRPRDAAWVVFDSPHSGSQYPADFRHTLSDKQIRAAEDSQVDDLFSAVPEKGGIMLRALFPRTYVDANRYETDIKPAMLSDPDNWPLEFDPTHRADFGHGIVRESLVHEQFYLYEDLLSSADVMTRITSYHRPYHRALEALINQAHARHGQVWHINCHSMPQSCVSPARRTDICLGDDFGKACHRAEFTDMLKDWLQDKGYRVDINVPFSGYRLVQDYSAPAKGRQSLQIEINKALYWNELTNKPNRDYERVKADMGALSEYIIDTTAARLMPMAAS